MSEEDILPQQYKPFETLIVCGNTLIHGKIPISIKGTAIFLIGNGKVPLIWINIPRKDSNGKWRSLVRENLSLHPDIRVSIEKISHVNVFAKNTLILKVKKNEDDKAEILYLDLRPIGFNIIGDEKGLAVGNQKMNGNTFKNTYIMIGLG